MQQSLSVTHCQDLFVCSLRRKYSFLFFPFCQSFSMEALHIPHALPSQTVFDSLSQRHNRLCHFISDIMDYFLAGEDQQQTNQPTTWLAVNPHLVILF